MNAAMLHAVNPVAMWRAVTHRYRVVARLQRTGHIRGVLAHAPRSIVLGHVPSETEPIRVIGRYRSAGEGEVLVEDPSGRHDVARLGLVPRRRMPVMVLAADGWARWRTKRDYLRAEAVMAAIFPATVKPSAVDPGPPRYSTFQDGRCGWCVAAGYRRQRRLRSTTVALTVSPRCPTLPEHRGHGVAGALMTAIIRRYRERTISLTATAMGAPLYRSLGFVSVREAAWWAPPLPAGPSGSDTGTPLR